MRPDYVCRVMPAKDSYVEGYVHPAIITPYPNKKMQGHMYHYTYDNWQQYFNKFNNYTTLAAEKYKKAGKGALLAELQKSAVHPNRHSYYDE